MAVICIFIIRGQKHINKIVNDMFTYCRYWLLSLCDRSEMHTLEKIQVGFMHLTRLTELQRSKNLFRKLVQHGVCLKGLLFCYMYYSAGLLTEKQYQWQKCSRGFMWDCPFFLQAAAEAEVWINCIERSVDHSVVIKCSVICDTYLVSGAESQVPAISREV